MELKNKKLSGAQARSLSANPLVLSPALILEGFKLYWYVPVLAFVLYFFGGIFPILTNYSDLTRISDLLLNNFQNWNMIFVPLLICLPLIAACLSMSFFHKESRALALHSQPFSKSRLFNSQIVSGWLMCILPLLLMTVLYLCLMKEVPATSWSIHGISDNVYTASAVFGWLFSSVSLMTFHYGMFILAGSLVGTSVMQILLSGVMFGIVPLVLWITYAYCDTFLIGYAGMSDTFEAIMLNSNPILSLLTQGYNDGFTLLSELKYLLAGVVMLLLARIAYAKAKLERVGDSMIFRITEEIITYLIVFVGMAAFGFVFYHMGADGESSRKLMLSGFAVGTLVTFIAVKIIIAKSIKIFNRANIISLCIFIVIGSIFVACTVFDATGYTKRVPDIDEVEAVSLSNSTFSSVNQDYYYVDNSLLKENRSSVDASEPEVIKAMLSLHSHAVEDMLYDNTNTVYIREYYSDDSYLNSDLEPSENIRFIYKLKNGRTFQRNFTIRVDKSCEELISKLVSSKSMKSYFTLSDNLELSRFDNASIQLNLLADKYPEKYYEMYGEEITYSDESLVVKTLSKAQVEGLFKAHDEDVIEHDYYYYQTDKEIFASSDLFIYLKQTADGKSSDENAGSSNIIVRDNGKTYAAAKRSYDENSELETASISFNISATDKNTLAYLRDIGVI